MSKGSYQWWLKVFWKTLFVLAFSCFQVQSNSQGETATPINQPINQSISLGFRLLLQKPHRTPLFFCSSWPSLTLCDSLDPSDHLSVCSQFTPLLSECPNWFPSPSSGSSMAIRNKQCGKEADLISLIWAWRSKSEVRQSWIITGKKTELKWGLMLQCTGVRMCVVHTSVSRSMRGRFDLCMLESMFFCE